MLPTVACAKLRFGEKIHESCGTIYTVADFYDNL